MEKNLENGLNFENDKFLSKKSFGQVENFD